MNEINAGSKADWSNLIFLGYRLTKNGKTKKLNLSYLHVLYLHLVYFLYYHFLLILTAISWLKFEPVGTVHDFYWLKFVQHSVPTA